MEIDYRWAYLAGLVDGEGTVSLARKNERGYRQPILSVANSSYPLILWLKETFGGTVVTKPRKREHWKDSYEWRIAGANRVEPFLKEILPFLREDTKLKRTKHILENYRTATPRNGHYTPERRKLKEQFEAEFFQL